ncbi:MAG TPA: hypothetical protein VGW40_12870 [Allosphingosinicella sp.]|nr:hypothetical protein [Allosphingosinicella sp.]
MTISGNKQSNGPEAECADQGNAPGETCGSACAFNIRVDAGGDVHIHNNCGAPAPASDEAVPTGDDCPCPAIGTCIPVVAGAKHKQSREQKLGRRAELDPVASAIATSVLHCMRRFLLGKTAANALEERAFAILAKLPREFLACNVAAVDALPAGLSNRLLVPSLLLDPHQAIDAPMLSKAVLAEIRQRAGLAMFGDPAALEQERPGLVRLPPAPPPGTEDFTDHVRICRINNLRTANYRPVLGAGEYLPEEFQQDCAVTVVNGEADVVCQMRTTDCHGHPLAGACARVIDVAQGDSILLQGVNFFSVDAKVRLTDKDTRTITREVDAFVRGDIVTPLEEMAGGAPRLINDCRVDDKLIFEVPIDLPAALYEIQVIVPNTSGDAGFGSELASNAEFIHVLPSPNARFQIVVERVRAVRETDPDWAGSDEVGLHTVACGLTLGQEATAITEVEFNLDGVEFDTGTARNVETLVYTSEQPILGLFVGVMGYEIDSQRAYNQQIRSRSAYFIDLVESQWQAIVGVGLSTIIGLIGIKVAAIGAAILAAADVLIALWAPADPIIEDAIGLSIIDLERLTNISVPPPPASFHTSANGINVNVNVPEEPEKVPFQYKETREYRCAAEGSKYDLRYRYNRLQ